MTSNAPSRPWTPADLGQLAAAIELEIAAPRASGEPGRWTPIWVVVVRDDVFVRTWVRRATGWYGRAAQSGRAWIKVSGESVEVIVTAAEVPAAALIDEAYRAKYGDLAARSMVTAEAAASTLRLSRARSHEGATTHVTRSNRQGTS